MPIILSSLSLTRSLINMLKLFNPLINRLTCIADHSIVIIASDILTGVEGEERENITYNSHVKLNRNESKEKSNNANCIYNRSNEWNTGVRKGSKEALVPSMSSVGRGHNRRSADKFFSRQFLQNVSAFFNLKLKKSCVRLWSESIAKPHSQEIDLKKRKHLYACICI